MSTVKAILEARVARQDDLNRRLMNKKEDTMLNAKMIKALNKQINEELFSSYLYLSMATWLEDKKFPGFASWMKKQSGEEYGHAMKIYHYLEEQGARIELDAIAKPQKDWASVRAIFEASLAHEQHITGCINDLVDQAMKLKDHATHIFLHWFISEQVEEEKSVGEMLDKLGMIGDKNHGLFMLDRDAGKR